MANVIQSGNWRAVPTKGGGAKGPARPVNNALLNPSQPLSGQALAQAAQALAQAQTSGPLAALAKQIAANNNQTRGTMQLAGGFYNQLGQQAQQGVTNERGIASDLNSTLQGISNQTNQQLQGLGQSAQDSLMKYAPQGEGGLSTAAMSSLASEIARQKGLAAQQEGASQMFGANQGANYSGLAAANQGTQALAGTEGLTKIGQSGTVKNQPLMNQVASLNAQKGSLYATDLGKLRQQEINNQITRSGLGIKSDAITAANNRTAATILGQNQRNAASIRGANARTTASLRAAAARTQAIIDAANKRGGLDRASRESIAALNRQARAQGKPPIYTPTGARVLTPVAQQRQFGELDTARALIPQMQKPLSKQAATSLQKFGYNVQEGSKLSEGQIRHLLAVGVHPGGSTRYDPGLVDAAYALAGYGYLTQKQVTELNKLGLIVGNRYKRGSQPTGLGGIGVGGVGTALGNIGNPFGR